MAAAVSWVVVLTAGCCCHAQDRPRFCLAEVKNGQPTKADFGEVSRMLGIIKSLPGIPRPMIFPTNRGGVWTIDESRALVPFGGDFPKSVLSDQFAIDPVTGRVIGVHHSLGIFVVERGETGFKTVLRVDGKVLSNLFDVVFIARMGKFVVLDRNGPFTIDRDLRVEPMKLSGPDVPQKFSSTIIDVPAAPGVLVSADSGVVYMIYDDGAVYRLGKLQPMISVSLADDADALKIGREYGRETSEVVPLPRPLLSRDMSWSHKWNRHAIYNWPPIFDHRTTLELPASGAVVEVSGANGISITLRDGGEQIVEGADRLGPFTHNVGLIEARNEVLLGGRRGALLLVDRKISGENACD